MKNDQKHFKKIKKKKKIKDLKDLKVGQNPRTPFGEKITDMKKRKNVQKMSKIWQKKTEKWRKIKK